MKTIYPPTPIPKSVDHIFLAGTIDNGNSPNWQLELERILTDHANAKGYNMDDLVLANPRRVDWDASWHAEHPELKKQILWELNALTDSTWIFMWIDGPSKSPITLLEFGLFARTNRLILGCPPEFYRAPNLYITHEFITDRQSRTPKYFRLAKTWDQFVLECKAALDDMKS